MLKLLLCALLLAVPVFANETDDRQTATSLKYVMHELDTRQDKLEMGANKALEYTDSAGGVEQRTVKTDLASGSTTDTSLPTVSAVTDGLSHKQDSIAPIDDHTAVTYTGTAGGIGTKGIYQTSGTYAEQSDNLIDAKTFNAALKNGLDSEFVCSPNHSPDGDCWLWEIHTTSTNSTVPAAYTQLEYIEQVGTTQETKQYIDTGVRGAMQIDLVAQRNTGTSGQGIVCGYSPSSGMYLLSSTSAAWSIANIGTPAGSAYNKTNLSFIKTLDQTILYADGQLIDTRNTTNFASNAKMYLFDMPSSNNIFVGKIYSAKIYQNDEMVRDFIPAKRNSDNAIGMYDTVSGTFFENVGNGTFGAGPELHNTVYIPQNQ